MRSIGNRLSLLRMVASLAAIAVLSLAVGVTEARADDDDSDSDSDDTIVVFVDVDETTFDQLETATGVGPFNVQGTIEGEDEGSFQCWGWISAGSSNVSQVYNIYDRGAIMTQGQEGTPLAIVGGTGDFSEAEGEAIQVFDNFPTVFDFTITFHLDD